MDELPFATDLTLARLSDAKLAELAQERGTPLYVYNLTTLRKRIAALRQALEGSNATLFFATMANDRAPVLRLMSELGVGACVNSVPHLVMASDCGFADSHIQFTSTGISIEDMRVLQSRCIRCNLDSIAQLEAWFKLGAKSAGLRINAASIGRGLPIDRIGIEASQLPMAAAVAQDNCAHISGLHIYVGTNFQAPGEMLPTLEGFFALAEHVGSLEYLNIGGGIGVNYLHDGPEFDIVEFGQGIQRLHEGLQGRIGRKIQLVVEPGRGLTANCGTMITAITDVKELSGRRYAVVDASIAVFPRPFHHPESPHRVRKLGYGLAATENGCAETVIVGRTTFSRDILGTLSNDSLQCGDLLAFDDAGAYSQSMASRFLGQREPSMAIIDG